MQEDCNMTIEEYQKKKERQEQIKHTLTNMFKGFGEAYNSN
jgi:hypothetical protein